MAESDLLTAKKVIYAANMDEAGFTGDQTENARLAAVQKIADTEGAMVLPICAKLEEDITGLAPDEKEMFLAISASRSPAWTASSACAMTCWA